MQKAEKEKSSKINTIKRHKPSWIKGKKRVKKRRKNDTALVPGILHNHIVDDSYNLESSSEKAFLMASLLILRAAVTRPESGVHGLQTNLIFAGISNLSKRAFFASCK